MSRRACPRLLSLPLLLFCLPGRFAWSAASERGVESLARRVCSGKDPAAAAALREGRLRPEILNDLRAADPALLERLRVCALDTGVCVERDAELAERLLRGIEKGSLAAHLRSIAPKRAEAIIACAREAAAASETRRPAPSLSRRGAADFPVSLETLFDGSAGRKALESPVTTKAQVTNAHTRPAPGDPGRLATEHFARGEFEDSLDMSEEALRSAPASPFRNYWLLIQGSALAQLGRTERAKSAYMAILQAAPASAWCADARVYLGLLEPSCSPAALDHFQLASSCPDRPEGAWVKRRAESGLRDCRGKIGE